MNPVLEQRLARSANWFYWIAGLSLVNAFAAQSHYEFILGSGARFRWTPPSGPAQPPQPQA